MPSTCPCPCHNHAHTSPSVFLFLFLPSHRNTFPLSPPHTSSSSHFSPTTTCHSAHSHLSPPPAHHLGRCRHRDMSGRDASTHHLSHLHPPLCSVALRRSRERERQSAIRLWFDREVGERCARLQCWYEMRGERPREVVVMRMCCSEEKMCRCL